MSDQKNSPTSAPAVDTAKLMHLIVKARKRIEELENTNQCAQEIAIIGLGCRFPGADSPAQLWQNLEAGVDAVGPLKDGRWDITDVVSKGVDPVTGKMRTADGGFLNGVADFDPAFFGISGREAKYLDPQQRLLLQTSWHAMEDAGLVPSDLSGSDTGVFVGISGNDYGRLQVGRPSSQEAWAGTGNALSISANRLSYLFNFKGPSLAIDTACSSSLVAMHHAIRALRADETSLALVAGINLILSPDISIAFSQAGMISPTGRCRTFDADADGYVRSEGVGVVVLKRRKDAERDGDNIVALLKGSAVNQDGQGNGLTAPNGLAQQAVVKAALKDAGATVSEIAYIEAHGTGTPLGDPIELNNLARVIPAFDNDEKVVVGALKSSIGHTEAAAGIAGVIKTALCMQAGKIPKQLLFESLNPHIKIEKSGLALATETMDWPADRDLAGVSSFGFGGTNSHVILSRYQQDKQGAVNLQESSVLLLSAKTEPALKRLARAVLHKLTLADKPPQLSDLAASLNSRRSSMSFRLAVAVKNNEVPALQEALESFSNDEAGLFTRQKRKGSRAPRLAFSFSGQGSHYAGMGRQLYAIYPLFKDAIDQCAAVLLPHCDVPLTELLFDDQSTKLEQTQYAQPAIFSLQYALTSLFASWAIKPDVVMGHSLGEYAAACAAGAAPVEHILPLVARRGALMQSLAAGGGMLSIKASEDAVSAAITAYPELSLAALNAPESTVVAGRLELLDELASAFSKKGIDTRALKVSHAFHSCLLDPMLEDMRTLAEAVKWSPLQTPLISNLSGAVLAKNELLDADYWVDHSRETVRYHKSLQTLADDPTTVVLEVGPKAILSALGKASGVLEKERFVASLTGRGEEDRNLMMAVAALSAHGLELSAEFLGEGQMRGDELPLYPFEQTRYWINDGDSNQLIEKPDSAASAPTSALPVASGAPSAPVAVAPAEVQIAPAKPLAEPPTDIHALFQDQLNLVQATINSQMALLQSQGDAPLPAAGAVPAALAETQVAPVALASPVVAEKKLVPAQKTAVAAAVASVLSSDEPVPLRPAAQVLWLLAQKSDNASLAYHVPVSIEMQGDLQLQHLQASVDLLVDRHDALRTVFPTFAEMLVLPAAHVAVQYSDARAWSEQQRQAWMAGLGDELFDLARGPLLRVKALQLESDHFKLCIEAHHLVFDGLSMNLLIQELGSVYSSLCQGSDAALPPAMSYSEYLSWNHQLRRTDAASSDRDYWLEKLGAGVDVLDLPTDRPRGDNNNYLGASELVVLDKACNQGLRAAAKELGLTPFMLLFAVFGAALARFSTQDQVALAIPTTGRAVDEDRSLIGYCSDILFALCSVDSADSLTAHSAKVRRSLLADFGHREYSFAWLVEDLKKHSGGKAELPLQVVFNYQNAYIDANFAGLESTVQPRPTKYLDAEITLNAVDLGGRLALEFNYDPELYNTSTAACYVGGFAQMLRAIAAGQRGSLAQLPMLDDAQLQQIKRLGEGPRIAAIDKTVHQLFEQRVAQQPDAVALLHGTEQLSYAELNSRANNLAKRLLDAGVSEGDLVGIHMGRCVSLVVAQIAINKAGGAFVYLDPRQPSARRSHIVQEAGIELVVGAQGELGEHLDVTYFSAQPVAGVDERNLGLQQSTDQLMYLIYTSGSTGQPKGVMIEHRTVSNYIAWLSDQLQVTASDRMLQFSALSFDTSIEEIYTALLNGASLLLREDELAASAELFWQSLTDNGVTLLDLPTAYWHALVGDEAAIAALPPKLRHIILGGEAVKPQAVQRWNTLLSSPVGLWNTYGPTETTIVCTAARLDQIALIEGRPAPIGVPVANAQAWVLDQNLQPLPAGAVGTLFIGGDTLARGYHGQSALSAEVFIANPLGDGRLYNTGDRVRWREDGQLEYLGRSDAQLKIRGFRIEPGEIEKGLEALDSVTEAKVVAKSVNGSQRLVAYVVPVDGASMDSKALATALGEKLAEYMVPKLYVSMPKLPINANGKVDLRALPEPADDDLLRDNEYTAPSTPTEIVLAGLWSELLGAEKVGVEDNFFELGGDSILCLQLVSRGKQAGLEFDIRDVFLNQQLAELAAVAKISDQSKAVVCEPGSIALLPAQASMLEGEAPSQLHSVRLNVGSATAEDCQRALQRLLEHHPALHTRFSQDQSLWQAAIAQDISLPLQHFDGDDSELNALLAQATTDTDSLLSALWVERDSARRLILRVHPLLADIESLRILESDLRQLVAEPQAELPVQRASVRQLQQHLHERQFLAEQGAVNAELTQITSAELSGEHLAWGADLDVTLSADLRHAGAPYRLAAPELLLAALSRVLTVESGSDCLVVDVQSNARLALAHDNDYARTVAAADRSQSLVFEADSNAHAALLSAKDQLRAHALQGAVANTQNQVSQLTLQLHELSQHIAPAVQLQALNLQLQWLADGRARLNWFFDSAAFSTVEIEQLHISVLADLQLLIQQCQDESAQGLSPSDFPLASQLSQQGLDSLMAEEPSTEDVFDATPGQVAMIFHTQMDPEAAVYLLHARVDFDSKLDIACLRSSFEDLLQRHTSLRTRFAIAGQAQPLQMVLGNAELPWTELDWSDKNDIEQALHQLERDDRVGRLSFDRAPMMRMTLVRRPDGGHTLMWLTHHGVTDGWSSSIVVAELAAIYNSKISGGTAELPPSIAHSEYVRWLNKQDADAALQYWREQLSDVEEPTRFSVPQLQSDNTAAQRDIYRAELAAVKGEQLNQTARLKHITQSSVLQGAWLQVLAQQSGQASPVLDVTVSGRPASLAGVEQSVGMYLGVVPLRVPSSPDQDIWSWLQQLQNRHLENDVNHYLHYAKIQACAAAGDQQGLSESILIFQNFPTAQALLAADSGAGDGTRLQDAFISSTGHEHTDYAVSLYATPADDGSIALDFHYDAERFSQSQIAEMAAQLLRLLERLPQIESAAEDTAGNTAGDAVNTMAAWLALDVAQSQQLRLLGAGAERTLDTRQTVVSAFEAQVDLQPQALALQSGEQQLSYAELDNLANHYAQVLLDAGVRRGDVVALQFGRDIALVVAQLAANKAGAAFVYLDPAFPEDRRAVIATEAGAKFALLGDDSQVAPAALASAVVVLDKSIQAARPAVALDARDLMYLIFTSGSTGKPKGVMLEHRSVLNYISWLLDELALSGDDKVLQFSSLNFDTSIEEIYSALISGAALVLRDEDMLSTPTRFWHSIERMGITLLDLPTAFWHVLCADSAALQLIPQSLRHIILGGEAAKVTAIQTWQEQASPQIKLWNTYGPTETTIVVTAHRLDSEAVAAGKPVPIGRPVANTQLWVLDDQRQQLAQGLPGTLYVGGEALARGYVGQPGLSDEVFISNPHGEGKLYNTGDRVRWREDGVLEYLGRSDAQLKIRGYRIEPGEVESALNRIDAVAQVEVIAQPGPGKDLALVAYVVPQDGQRVDAVQLRAHAREALPAYMVPAAIVVLDTLPINHNGKVDKRALPAVDWAAASNDAPLTPLNTDSERVIAQLWSSVLGRDIDVIGGNSNFFDLGGDSLLAMQVLARMNQEQGVELALRDMYHSNELSGMAELLSRAPQAGSVVSVQRVSRDGPLQLSSTQQRLWFLQQLDPASGMYNLPLRLAFSGDLDVDKMRMALHAIAQRHESLRTRFSAQNGEGVALISATGELPLALVDLSAEQDADSLLANYAKTEAGRAFELDGGELVRATLYKTGEAEHTLLLCAHHIITDGWSMNLLARDFITAYTAADAQPLPPINLQYVDYAAHIAQSTASAENTEELVDYWRSQLADLPELLELPTDYARPQQPDGKGRVHRFNLSAELTTQLHKSARQIGVTPYAVLLSAYGLLLARLSGQPAFAVGTATANRSLPGADEVVGFFADTLALRFDAEGEPLFSELCKKQQEQLLDAMAHEDLPFERLVEALVQDRNESYSPIFQTMFVWQNTPQQSQRIEGLDVRSERLDKGAIQFDLVLDMAEENGEIIAMMEYRTQLFAPETIERLSQWFTELLSQSLQRVDTPVGQLQFVVDQTPAVSYPLALDDKRVDAILDGHAEATPDATAILFEAADGQPVRLNWREYRQGAEAMALYLQSRGIGHGDKVVLCSHRCPELMVAIYAIMKAGAVYVPLDPDSPPDRQQALLKNCGAKMLLTQRSLLGSFCAHGSDAGVESLFIDEEPPEVDAGVELQLSHDAALPIYIIYTSGTTGTPKGVVVPHRGVANMALGMADVLSVGNQDSLLQFAPFNFDASALQIFVPLLVGGSSVLHHNPKDLGAADFMNLCEKHQITVLDLPAALWRQWVDTMAEQGMRMASSVRVFLTGGEAVPSRSMRAWANLCDQRVSFLSSYGPTEASITALAYVSDSDQMRNIEDADLNLGQALPNVGIQLLDLYGQRAAPGVIGEIAISGPGVADGYLGLDAQTEAVFLYSEALQQRIYLTGDYGRRNASGALEFHGRRDAQIKIRGFRIEPGEIEAALLAHDDIAEALVTTQRSEDQRLHLISYAVLSKEALEAGASVESYDVHALKQHLQQNLPAHMVPAAIQLLPEFPLLPTGKVNRKVLAVVDLAKLHMATYVAPEGEQENELAELWQALLGVEQVGRDDNFFELGGDSILSLQLVARAKQQGLHFEVRDVFQYQSLATLAAAAGSGSTVLAEQGAVSGEAAVLPHQLRYFNGTSSQPRIVQLVFSEPQNEEALLAALHGLTEQHDALRSQFVQRDEQWLQSIGAAIDEHFIQHATAQNFDQRLAELSTEIAELEGPLFRALIDNERLALIAHPALLDQHSTQILLEDLHALYSAHAAGRVLDRATKTTSVLQYSDWLAGEGSDWAASQAAVWQSDTQTLDGFDQRRAVADVAELTVELAESISPSVLLAYGISAEEIIATAFVTALQLEADSQDLLLHLVSAGRDKLPQEIDLSRTATALQQCYPQLFAGLPRAPRDAIITVKEQLRAVPAVVTGPLLSDRLGQRVLLMPSADLGTNTDQAWSVTAQADDAALYAQCFGLVLSYELDKSSVGLKFSYDSAVFDTAQVLELAQRSSQALKDLIDHCATVQATVHTPSDFPLATTTQQELDALTAKHPGMERLYEASFGQVGMLFHSLFSPENGAYLLQTQVRLNAALDRQMLHDAFADLIQRHPVLRSTFAWENRKNPLQLIHSIVDTPWSEVDLSAAEDFPAAYEALLQSDRIAPLDFERAPLMRLTLVQRPDGDYSLLWLMHHAITDGWSTPLLYDDLLEFYNARHESRAAQLPPVVPYERYIAWLQGQSEEASRQHWLAEVGDFDSPTDLNIGRGRAAETEQIAISRAKLSVDGLASVEAMARAERVTMSSVVQGLWAVLLSRYSAGNDVLMGVTVSGRPPQLQGSESIVGMFLNALPLRAQVDEDADLWQWLRDLQARHAENDAHNTLNFLDVQKLSRIEVGERLTESMLIFQNTPLGEAIAAAADGDGFAPGQHLQRLVLDVAGFQKTNYPITVFAEVIEAELQINIQYDQGRYEAHEMELLAARLSQLLSGVAGASRVSDLSLLSGSERESLLSRSEGEQQEYGDSRSLLELFEQQCARTPDGVALFEGDQSCTYAELQRQANLLAVELAQRGVSAGDVVALCAERSVATTAALLAILKTGAAFLALDPKYPVERLLFMLQDSAAVSLIYQPRKTADELLSVHIDHLDIDAFRAADSGQSCDAPMVDVSPDSLAYLIYTSGSTGQPKGVRALQSGTLNRLHWMWRELPFADGEVMVQKTALSFVDSIWEVFGPLLKGVPSLVLSEDKVRDVTAFVAALAEHNISRLVLVPTLLRAMLDIFPDLGERLPALRQCICSGEALSGDLVADLRRAAPQMRLINLYGSSEVAADVTYFDTAEMAGDDLLRPASIGRPIDNSSVYILDAQLKPVPEGLPGELYIGGANVADGYHQQPLLSDESFLHNPFAAGKMFRSRDWGRRSSTGSIEFLGRQDSQIKIRGMRVELDEIASQLRSLAGVEAAVVINRARSNGDARIVSYSTGSGEMEQLRSQLVDKLPAHMVPSAMVSLDQLPLLPNGKIDRQALPDPADSAFAAQTVEFRAPESESEKVLASIWAQVLALDVDKIGTEHNYFQLGGDSISSLQVVTRAKSQGYQLEVRDVFSTDNLRELAVAAIALNQQPLLQGTIELGQHWPALALSDYQRVTIPVGVDCSLERGHELIQALMSHHDILRARFVVADGATSLVISDELNAESLIGGDELLSAHAGVALNAFTARLHSDAAVHTVEFLAHPLLLDNLSWQLLAEDWQSLLDGKPLAAKTRAVTEHALLIPSKALKQQSAMEHKVQAAWVGALTAKQAERLHANIDELAAAALLNSYANFQLDQAPAISVSTRDSGAERTALMHTVQRSLPASSGDIQADLVAAKQAVREGGAEQSAPMLLQVVGGSQWADKSIKHSGARLCDGDHTLRLEVELFADQLLMRLYGVAADKAGQFEQALLKFALALHQLSEIDAADSISSYVPSDFPLVDLQPQQLTELLQRQPQAQNIYPAAPGQTGMVFHAMLEPENAVYTLHSTVRLAAGADAIALQTAFNKLIERHSILRTAFDWQQREAALQVVQSHAEMPLQVLQWDELSTEEFERDIKRLSAKDQNTPLDIRVAPLMRGTLVFKHDGSAVLLWLVHHAITDGWSLPILYGDLISCYNEAVGHSVAQLPPSPDYADYMQWLQAQDATAASDYWRTQLAGMSSGSDLVMGAGAEAETHEVGSHKLHLPPALVDQLLKRSRREQVTLNTVVQGAWAALLSRYNQQDEQLVGVTVSGRPADLNAVEEMVGLFVNVLPLRIGTRDSDDVWTWMREIQQTHHNNDRYNFLPFAEIQQLSDFAVGERLCESMIVFQNYPVDDQLIAAVSGDSDKGSSEKEPLERLLQSMDGHQTTSYPITLFVIPGESELEIEFQYDEGRFSPANIDAMGRHLLQLFHSLCEAQTLQQLDILSEDAEFALLQRGAGACQPRRSEQSLIEVFERRCDVQSETRALIDGPRELSFAQLDAMANNVALCLREQGVAHGDIVAVHMQRSLETVAALLAVMKVGAAWVALDPNYPADRLAYMLSDSGAGIVLHDGVPLDVDSECRMIDVPAYLQTVDGNAPRQPLSLVPDDLAYLIYTSGSTGKPKGVQALHSGALNRLDWMWREMPFAESEVMVQKTALSFVDSVWETFGPLLAGTPSVICSAEQLQNTMLFIDLLAEQKVSRLLLVPSLLRLMLEMPGDLRDKLPELKQWIVSGEALTAELVLQFRKALPEAKLINLYGSSEVAGDISYIDTSLCDLAGSKGTVPIGKILDNNTAYVLDRRLKPMPHGMPGELYFSGANLARGYHGSSALSEEAFLVNPYGDGKLFRSKDWGRFDQDFNIEFLGRQDGQIKIRGMRVELGEIETVLRGQPGVNDAVVLPKQAPGGSVSLVAYWAGEGEQEALRSGVQSMLAMHMVPTQWVSMQQLPLLPNGKIDRQALAGLQILPSTGAGASALGYVENELLPLWAALFETDADEMDVEQSFFALGGHSLLAARAIAEISERTGVAIGLKQFFDTSSIRGIARTIELELLASVAPEHLQQMINRSSTQLARQQAQ